MFVKTFEADSLDQALQAIKLELGPDAIIMKTVTNKGIKGALKKKKYEITAAISEKDYKAKSKVDSMMTDKMKNKFYQSPASEMSKTINYINDNQEDSDNQDSNSKTQGNSGYSKLGLNKIVRQAKDTIKSGLDDFLGDGPTPEPVTEYHEVKAKKNSNDKRMSPAPKIELQSQYEEEYQQGNVQAQQEIQVAQNRTNYLHEAQLLEYEKRIEQLERKMGELLNNGSFLRVEETTFQTLRTQLVSLNIDERYIQKIIKKLSFELKPEEKKDLQLVTDYNLKLMSELINISNPLFTYNENKEKNVLTVLLSAGSCGQSSMVLKMATLRDRATVIRYVQNSKNSSTAQSEKMLGIDVIEVHSISELVTQIKKSFESMKSVFVDYEVQTDFEETKKMIDGLHRSFPMLEVLLHISALHTQNYNVLQLNKYQGLIDGVTLSHLDWCLDFGQIFNLCYLYPQTKWKMFGTGKTIPQDIEVASKERILGSIFQFN